MRRRPVVVVTLAVAGAIAGLAYSYVARSPASSDEIRPASGPQPTARSEIANDDARSSDTQAPGTPERIEPASAPGTTAGTIAQWIADTQSTDARVRAAAIAALAEAPKAEALPALKRVLKAGEPEVDRQIAVRSLHVLALREADDDGAIRNVLRDAMYHGDDDGVTQSAQAVLEDIEAEFALRASSR